VLNSAAEAESLSGNVLLVDRSFGRLVHSSWSCLCL